MDTKFSIALHILTMISESEDVLSSQALANSVGSNASFIRKVIALLKKAGLMTSQQGRSGYQLSKNPKEISLLEIYRATQEEKNIHLFQIHQNANKECPVGRHIENAMQPIFSSIEKQLEEEMQQQTLDNVINNLYSVAQVKRNK